MSGSGSGSGPYEAFPIRPIRPNLGNAILLWKGGIAKVYCGYDGMMVLQYVGMMVYWYTGVLADKLLKG